MTELEARAKEFATYWHGSIDQRRKYTNEPYIVHPAAVAKLVRSVPHTEAMLCAAWLHDVLEDTPAQHVDIYNKFGRKIFSMVLSLTDVSTPFDGNRAVRKAIDLVHTAKASAEAKTVKLADLIDNTKSIVAHDPTFAKVYLEEKALLLDVLREGDASLMAISIRQVIEGRAEL